MKGKIVMTTDLIKLYEDTQKLPELYEQIKDLPTKALSEQVCAICGKSLKHYNKVCDICYLKWY